LFLPPPRRTLCNQVGLSVTVSVFEHDYCKSNQPISWKLGVTYQSEEFINFWW